MLNLYRRHDRKACPAGHKPDSQSYESDELRPKWKKCGCPIYASGKLGSNPKFRKNTKRFTWPEARAVADDWERRGITEPEPLPPPPPILVPPPVKQRMTIKEACKRCVKDYEENGCAKTTVDRYVTLTRKVMKFATEVKGYEFLDQWTFDDTQDFRTWHGGMESSRRTTIAQLKSFFELARERRWVSVTTIEGLSLRWENPARFRTRKKNRAQALAEMPSEKSPYIDSELRRMIVACKKLDEPRPYRGGTRSKITGVDLEDFILISAHTGLRISDVALFHISRLAENGDVHFRALKNGNWVDTWVPEWLQERIRSRAEQFGPFIFGKPKSTEIDRITHPWRTALERLWATCGPWTEAPTHHRFRHTFVRMLLEAKTSVEEVAELLGDTEEVVRRSYSKWVPGRQDNMRATLQKALGHKAPLFAVK